jgi:penicillin-binding protein 2D
MPHEHFELTNHMADPLSGPPSGSNQKNKWIKRVTIPLLGGFFGMSMLLVLLRILPLPDASLVSPTEIESADGTRLTEWTLEGAQTRRVDLRDIPRPLIQATLAVEDANFYHHRAFHFQSLIRAMLVNLKDGHVVEGGSTITQQLAKNLYLSQDRTIIRKLKEGLYAISLELHESKDMILSQYLNVVYYGHGAYGVGSAAELYFNKPVQDLDIAESALIAGLPKGPSIFSPIEHFAAAKHRQRLVLDRMVSEGYLTKQEADNAYHETLHISLTQRPIEVAPYFTTAAISEVKKRFQITADDLYAGDMSITTTLDPLLQQSAERAIRTTLPKNSGIEAALVAIDPKTGAIRAMVGGRNFTQSPYNRVFAERQPGSTFKAVLYTSALEHGWTPANQINSEMTTFEYGEGENSLYTVHDYGDYYANRPLTLREAIARSDNVYAVSTNIAIGPHLVVDTAKAMGIHSTLHPYPALALGVFPTSPLQMATAYATLANGGFQVTPFTVSQVRSVHAGKIYQTNVKKVRTIDPDVAYQMTDLLTSVFDHNGTGHAVKSYLHGTAAAKTGTTDTDAWMVGYTPNLVCAVWVGYDTNRNLTTTESHLAAPIWAKFMGTAQVHNPSDWYQPPEDLVRVEIDPLTAKIATDKCAVKEVDYFVKGTEPTEYCPLHPSDSMGAHDENRIFTWLKRWF